MQSKDVKNTNAKNKATKAKENTVDVANSKPVTTNPATSTHVVTADAVQAEEVPTIPLGSLETISTLQPEVSVRSVASTRSVNIPTSLVTQSSEYRRSVGEALQVWWDGIRPAYLLLPLLPVCIGSVFAWLQTVSTKTPFGRFHTTHFIGMLLAIVFIQIGANLINDYYDYLRGIDTSNALGPGGLIQQGLSKPSRVLSLGLTTLAFGGFIGILVASAGGPLVYLLGAIGLFCAYFYSATSRSLSALTLGELVSFFLFGPLITLGAYLVMAQTGHIDRTILSYSIPLGLLAAATVHANNMRDIEGDAYANRRTLASTLGIRWSRWLYGALILAAYIPIIVLSIPHGAPHFLLLTLWTLPILVVALTGAMRTDTPAGLHLVMHQTLKLETYFALFMLIALLITTFLQIIPNLPSHLLP
ncbi:MAG: 1,4-dihydroxy-2-naphthoate polyprenyltransferase [Ktedonobacteraceae bacterium]